MIPSTSQISYESLSHLMQAGTKRERIAEFIWSSGEEILGILGGSYHEGGTQLLYLAREMFEAKKKSGANKQLQLTTLPNHEHRRPSPPLWSLQTLTIGVVG
jgi:hypothetical protein